MFACVHVISDIGSDIGSGIDSGIDKTVEPLEVRLRRCAERFAPWVEFASPEDVVFGVDGLELLYGAFEEIGEQIVSCLQGSGIEANVSIAVNAEAALLGARNLPGLSVIAPEHTSEVLGRFGIESLVPAASLLDVLHSWGIRTLADLAALPENELVARLGPGARRLQLMARGLLSRPLDPLPLEVEYFRQAQFDYPVRIVESLSFSLAASLRDLCQELQDAGLSADRLILELRLSVPGEVHELNIRLPFPSTDSRHLLRVLQFELEKHPPKKGVAAYGLRLNPVRPRTVQRGLFIPQSPPPDKLELTVARLRVMVGDQNVGIARLCDSHRPRAFELVPHQLPAQQETEMGELAEGRLDAARRLYTPARRARVRLSGIRPHWVEAGDIKGKVEECAGPWRNSGHWWDEWNWQREEWDVALSNGGVYVIFHCLHGWFVEAEYD